jgi:hypothetical protein
MQETYNPSPGVWIDVVVIFMLAITGSKLNCLYFMLNARSSFCFD